MNPERIELTPQRLHAIRQQNDEPSVALVLYLDLPPSMVEDHLERHDDVVLAFDRTLSLALMRLVEENPGVAYGINDEAARAIALFLHLGPDRQATLASLVEEALNSRPGPGRPDLFAGANVEATWRFNMRCYGFDEAERIRKEDEAVQADVDLAANAGLSATVAIEVASALLFPSEAE